MGCVGGGVERRGKAQVRGEAAATCRNLLSRTGLGTGKRGPELTSFLRETAVLRELSPAACDAVTNRSGSEAHLEYLHERDLFLVQLGPEQFRYHHLFHDFLHQQHGADPYGVRERHRRAAAFFSAQQDAGRAGNGGKEARQADETHEPSGRARFNGPIVRPGRCRFQCRTARDVVSRVGFEPTTKGLKVPCSTTELPARQGP